MGTDDHDGPAYGRSDRWVRAGNWKGSVGSSFFGTIFATKHLASSVWAGSGQAIARRAIGFRMKVLYYNRRPLPRSMEEECRAEYATKEDLLGRSDFVVLACRLTLRTTILLEKSNYK